MKSTVSYADLPTSELKDSAARVDMMGWLSPTQWAALRDIADVAKDFTYVACCLEFMGVSGYPVHAFGRAYALRQYRAWMHADGIRTDAQGFAR